MKHHIFLSYRRADREIANALVNALEARGLDVWWDDEIEGGVDWRDDIVENLMNSGMVVILFSEECNTSKQLKKELAVADQMDKNIIPVLIEDTTPKGHYLYELASRNWIQIHPEAMTKIDRLVEKLVTIVSQIPSGLESSPQPPPAIQETSHATPPMVEQSATAPPQVVASPLVPPPIPADQAAKTVPGQKIPLKEESAKKKEEDTKALRDFLPFQRGDRIPLSLIGILGIIMMLSPPPEPGWNPGFIFLCVMFLIYGVVVFPVRYYQRHLRPSRVARMLFLSNLVLFLPTAFLFALDPQVGISGVWDFIGVLFVFAFIVAILVGISLLIYFIACGQRALRSFRSNVEKL